MAKPLTLTGFLNNWRKWYMEVRLSLGILGALVQTFPALRSAQSSAKRYLGDYLLMWGPLFGAFTVDHMTAKVYSLNPLKKGSEIFAIGCLNILHIASFVNLQPNLSFEVKLFHPYFPGKQAAKPEPNIHHRQGRLRWHAY